MSALTRTLVSASIAASRPGSWSVLAVWVLLFSLAPLARAGNPYELLFEPVTEDVILAYRPDVSRYPVVGNAVIIFNRDDVVLVDGGGAAGVAEQIVSVIRQRTENPLTHLIVTHWHADHTVALDRYRKHYPEVTILSHPFTRERIAGALIERVKGFGESARALIAKAELSLAAGISQNGLPMKEAERAYLRQMLEDQEAIFREKDSASATVPDKTVEQTLTLRSSDRAIEVHFLGRANSPGDLVIYLPQEKLMIGGDIVTFPVPFGYPKYPHELVEAIDRMLAFDFERLIPGHGPVLNGRDYAKKVRELVNRTNQRIDTLVAQEMSLQQIRQTLDLSEETRLFSATGDAGRIDEKTAYFFNLWYVAPVVERTYNESTGLVR